MSTPKQRTPVVTAALVVAFGVSAALLVSDTGGTRHAPGGRARDFENSLSSPGCDRGRWRANVGLRRHVRDLLGYPGQIRQRRRIPRDDLKCSLEAAAGRDEISSSVGGHSGSRYGVVRGRVSRDREAK